MSILNFLNLVTALFLENTYSVKKINKNKKVKRHDGCKVLSNSEKN